MHSELCPVCHGTGEVDRAAFDSTDTSKKPCHGCNGRGWVEVKDDKGPTVYPVLPKTPWIVPDPLPYVPPYEPYVPYIDPFVPVYEDWKYWCGSHNESIDRGGVIWT